MDSTYKTNGSKFELFAIMESVMGTEIPKACMFLQSGTQIDWNHDAHGDVFVVFLQSVKISLPNLKSKFFLTYKDSDQMNAIRTVFGLSPTHMFLAHEESCEEKDSENCTRRTRTDFET